MARKNALSAIEKDVPAQGSLGALPRLAIIMPTFNRKAETLRCIGAAAEAVAADSNAVMVVVDNGSTDGTWEEVQRQFGELAIVAQFRGVPISTLRNEGARLSEAELLCFLDSDCVAPNDYANKVRSVFEKTGADVVGAMYSLPEDAHWIESTWMRLNCPPREGPATLLPGGCLSIRSGTMRKVGGFDPAFTTGEDADLCERVISSNGTIYESESLAVVHLRNMRSVRGFFAKQVWHSLGRVASTGRIPTDRVTHLSLGHVLLTLVGVVVAIWLKNIEGYLLLLVCLLVAPAIAVLYRVLLRKGAFIPMKSLFLYSVYFYARAYGSVRAVLRLRERIPLSGA